jgi:hypothetical protein
VVTVQQTDRRDVIVRGPFVSEDVGEMIAWHDTEGPSIDVRIEPEDSGQRVQFALTPSEARLLAGQLTEIAATAQRAGWTPEVLANVRERYLPGMSDEQIMERLDALTARLGGLVLGVRGRIDWRAGRMLVAEAAADAAQRAQAALDTTEQHLLAAQQAAEQLTAVRADLERVHRFYEAESGRR